MEYYCENISLIIFFLDLSIGGLCTGLINKKKCLQRIVYRSIFCKHLNDQLACTCGISNTVHGVVAFIRVIEIDVPSMN